MTFASFFSSIFPGLCKGSRFDRKYSWTRDIVGDFYAFSGYKASRLEFDRDAGQWRIGLYYGDGDDGETSATVDATDYPFGARRWTVRNDPCFGARGSTEVEVELNLNACNESEYNCADGQCVPIHQRCDGTLNCDDKSGDYNERGSSY